MKKTILHGTGMIKRFDETEVLHGIDIDVYAGEYGFVFQRTHLVSNLTLEENIRMAGLTEAAQEAYESNLDDTWGVDVYFWITKTL